jgi:hypothetical protein
VRVIKTREIQVSGKVGSEKREVLDLLVVESA